MIHLIIFGYSQDSHSLQKRGVKSADEAINCSLLNKTNGQMSNWERAVRTP